MKIIVRESATKQYFSPSGQMVTCAKAAEDFLSLLPAYHFAKHNISGHFQVICHCPEDNYQATIAAGIGLAE